MGRGWLERLFGIRRDEAVPAVLSAVFFFLLLFGYFMLRPLRETMGLRTGIDRLHWLFVGTVLAMVVANVAYAFVAARLPRAVLVPSIYGVAIASMGVFLALMLMIPEDGRVWLGSVFYVWLSVFNLFAVSVFWQLMADLFTLEQSKRLFGIIGVGGTAGAMTGSSYAWTLAPELGPVGLISSAAVLIAAAGAVSLVLCRIAPRSNGMGSACSQDAARGRALGGTAWAGLLRLVGSRYLSGIGVMVMLFSIGSTLLYFEKMRIVGELVEDQGTRTSLFALIELAGQTLTIVLQVLFTGRLLRWLGVGAMLAVVPLVTVAGFALLVAVVPVTSLIGYGFLGPVATLSVVAVFEAARRAGNFAFTKPARETLFTIVPREDKYKAKAGIDTFVYRGGDTVGAATDAGLAALRIPGGAVAIPLGIAGVWIALWLGRRVTDQQSRRGLPHGSNARGVAGDGDRVEYAESEREHHAPITP